MSSKKELGEYEYELKIQALQRKERLQAWNDYTAFATSKLSGVTAVVCGGLDVVNPSLIPHISHPEMLLGAGLGLLTGKSVLSFISKIATALGR
jgi:hypothetical protein